MSACARRVRLAGLEAAAAGPCEEGLRVASRAEPEKRWGRRKESLGDGRRRWLLLITTPGVSLERCETEKTQGARSQCLSEVCGGGVRYALPSRAAPAEEICPRRAKGSGCSWYVFGLLTWVL